MDKAQSQFFVRHNRTTYSKACPKMKVIESVGAEKLQSHTHTHTHRLQDPRSMVIFFLFFRNKKIKREAWEERGTKISNSLPKKKKKWGETDRRDLKTFETTAGSYFIFEK